jgi:hypothetical protein
VRKSTKTFKTSVKHVKTPLEATNTDENHQKFDIRKVKTNSITELETQSHSMMVKSISSLNLSFHQLHFMEKRLNINFSRTFSWKENFSIRATSFALPSAQRHAMCDGKRLHR